MSDYYEEIVYLISDMLKEELGSIAYLPVYENGMWGYRYELLDYNSTTVVSGNSIQELAEAYKRHLSD